MGRTVAVEVTEGENVGVRLAATVGGLGEFVGVIVGVVSMNEERGVLDGRTCVEVWLGKLALEVGLGGMAVEVSLRTFSVGVETRSDNLVSSFSIAGLPGPAKSSHPIKKSPKTMMRLMTRDGVRIVRRSRNKERSGTACVPGIKSERRSSSKGGVSLGLSGSVLRIHFSVRYEWAKYSKRLRIRQDEFVIFFKKWE